MMAKRLNRMGGGMLFLASLAFAFVLGSSAAIASPDIRILPPNPRENDDITIRVSGSSGDTCVPRYVSHGRTGNTISIVASKTYPPGTVCSFVVTDWNFTVQIGRLPAGRYTVRVRIDNDLYDSATFDVTGATPRSGQNLISNPSFENGTTL